MSRPPAPRRRRKAVAGLAALVTAAGGAALLAPGTSSASSHREAPLTSANPLIDNTDTYAFVSPDKPDTTTLIANWIPFEDPAGGPNFYPFGTDGYRYNIKVDNDGDAQPDLTFRWTFRTEDLRSKAGGTFLYNNGPVDSLTDPNLLFRQYYTLEAIDEAGKATLIVDNGKVAPSNVGQASMPNYAALRDQAVTNTRFGGRSFAGQADDPFFLDLRIFDFLYGGDLSERGSDTLRGYNTNSVALQVPTSALTAGGDGSGVVGVWSTTDQKSMVLNASGGGATPTGSYVQVSRLGSPLVNEVVLPAWFKDAFNSFAPSQDRSAKAGIDKVLDPEVPKLLEAIYGVPAPAAPRDDLFAVFATGVKGLNQPTKVVPAEMLRLNTGIKPSAAPNRLGVLANDTAGFPNGRRLTDDVVDIELQALAGALRTGIVPALADGDQVNQNDLAFGKAFPYLALPHSGSNTAPRGTSVSGAGAASTSATTAPTGAVPAGAVAAGGSDGSLPVLPVSGVLLGTVVAGAGFVLGRRRSA